MADLIDRQAALDALGERPLLSGDCEWEIAARKQYDDDRAAIENVPSAQPERKNGKWIYLDELGVFECSSCGGQMVRNVFHYCPWCGAVTENASAAHYCYNCGADMRGGVDGADGNG